MNGEWPQSASNELAKYKTAQTNTGCVECWIVAALLAESHKATSNMTPQDVRTHLPLVDKTQHCVASASDQVVAVERVPRYAVNILRVNVVELRGRKH